MKESAGHATLLDDNTKLRFRGPGSNDNDFEWALPLNDNGVSTLTRSGVIKEAFTWIALGGKDENLEYLRLRDTSNSSRPAMSKRTTDEPMRMKPRVGRDVPKTVGSMIGERAPGRLEL